MNTVCPSYSKSKDTRHRTCPIIYRGVCHCIESAHRNWRNKHPELRFKPSNQAFTTCPRTHHSLARILFRSARAVKPQHCNLFQSKGGLRRAWADFITASRISLFLVISDTRLRFHIPNNVSKTESISTTLFSMPSNGRQRYRRTGIDKLTIYFVKKKEQSYLIQPSHESVHLATGVQITGRVIRIANQYRFGAFIFYSSSNFSLSEVRNPLRLVVANVRIGLRSAEMANAI